nr:TetR family transcriptional regulator [Neobacillus massiliamazoniensis]
MRNAAIKFSMKQGYHATFISEVANEADLMKGSLYKGKEELLSTSFN